MPGVPDSVLEYIGRIGYYSAWQAANYRTWAIGFYYWDSLRDLETVESAADDLKNSGYFTESLTHDIT